MTASSGDASLARLKGRFAWCPSSDALNEYIQVNKKRQSIWHVTRNSVIWRKIIAVVYATFAVVKRKPEKKNRFVRDSNPLPLRPVQRWYSAEFFSGFLFATAKVAYITAMIFLQIILHSAVHIQDFHIFIISRNSVKSLMTHEPKERLRIDSCM